MTISKEKVIALLDFYNNTKGIKRKILGNHPAIDSMMNAISHPDYTDYDLLKGFYRLDPYRLGYIGCTLPRRPDIYDSLQSTSANHMIYRMIL